MSSQTISCPFCGQSLLTCEERAGRNGTCPRCHQMFRYPVSDTVSKRSSVSEQSAPQGHYPSPSSDSLQVTSSPKPTEDLSRKGEVQPERRGWLSRLLGRGSGISGDKTSVAAEVSTGRPPKLICPLCGECYMIGVDATIITGQVVEKMWEKKGAVHVGSPFGAGDSGLSPHLVGHVDGGGEYDGATVRQIREWIAGGHTPKWYCRKCMNDANPIAYPSVF